MKKYKTRTGEIVLFDDNWDALLKKYMAIRYFEFPITFSVDKNGYVKIHYGYEIISAHRAMMNIYGKQEIDHINNNKLDNRLENLRLCTRQENVWNRGVSKTNTTGYKGVRVMHGKKKDTYSAQITVSGKTIRLGTFDTIEEAAIAYDEAALKYHGMFAKTNKELGLLEKTNAKPIPLPSC